MDDHHRQIYHEGKEAYKNGRPQEAERLLSEFVIHVSGYADVHNILGVLLANRDETDQAITHFRQALVLNPNYSEARLNLMAVLDSVGRLKEAESIFAEVGGNVPKSTTGRLDSYTEGKLSNLHAEIGDIYQGAGFYDEAIGQYRRALQLKPDFPDIRVKLGIALRDKGYIGQAIEAFQQALKDSSANLSAALHLGITYYNSGQLEEAKRQWESVLEKRPDHKTAISYLEMIKR